MENISDERLRTMFRAFNRFMMLLWKLGLGKWGNGTKFGGFIMVLKHTGRKSCLIRHTPVNYTIVDGDVYCTAAMGKRAEQQSLAKESEGALCVFLDGFDAPMIIRKKDGA